VAASNQRHRITAWDTATAEEIAQFDLPDAEVSCLALSADGKLVIAGANIGEYGRLQLWDIPGPAK